jgi:hypothetical protein
MNAEELGFPLIPIELEHRATLTEFFGRYPQPLSDYTFASLCAWSPISGYRWGLVAEDLLFVSSAPGAGAVREFLQPIGNFHVSVQQTVLRRARELSAPLVIGGVSEDFLRRHTEFAAHFEITPQRDRANYVYAAEDLACLAGRRYAKKRNHLAQAAELGWTAEPLGPRHLAECLEIADDIAIKRTEGGVTLQDETRALERALHLFGPLQLRGLLVRVGPRPAAFSIFDRLGPSTMVVLFERAVRSLHGMYQVINRETARVMLAEGAALINREDDLGDPGLRGAKLSYYPIRLEMAYRLTYRG